MNNQHLNVSLEIKELAAREFEGHGSVFRNVDLGGDIVVPGAFKDTLADYERKQQLPPMFWMHSPDQVPGVWTEMREDQKGLYVRGELVDTQLGNEMRTLLQKKAVRGMSIGYKVTDFDFDDDGNRLLKSVDLWEVSLVSLAMNPLAQVMGSKSRLSADGEYIPTLREFERVLRDAGCSRKTAMTIVASLSEEDVDDESCGMPDSLRDAGDIDGEGVAAVKRALERYTDSTVRGIFRV